MSVSVWNYAVTTVEQARTFRPTVDVRPYLLEVIAVRAVDPRIDVVEDPVVGDPRPGAEGHCGILGLDRAPNETRGSQKNRLEAVAEVATPIESW